MPVAGYYGIVTGPLSVRSQDPYSRLGIMHVDPYSRLGIMHVAHIGTIALLECMLWWFGTVGSGSLGWALQMFGVNRKQTCPPMWSIAIVLRFAM